MRRKAQFNPCDDRVAESIETAGNLECSIGEGAFVLDDAVQTSPHRPDTPTAPSAATRPT